MNSVFRFLYISSRMDPVSSLLDRPGSVEPVLTCNDSVKSECVYLDLPVDLPMLAPEFPVAHHPRTHSLFDIDEDEDVKRLVRRDSHLANIHVDVAISALEETAIINNGEPFHTLESFSRAIGQMARESKVDCLSSEIVKEVFNSIASCSSSSLRMVTSAVVLLTKGNMDEKIRAIFNLADTDKDGSLSLTELHEFFLLIFGNVMTRSVLGIMNANGVPLSHPDKLAAATATECMDMCDLDRNGCLSLIEFSNWFHRPKKGPVCM